MLDLLDRLTWPLRCLLFSPLVLALWCEAALVLGPRDADRAFAWFLLRCPDRIPDQFPAGCEIKVGSEVDHAD